jgi:hypothetical protein
MVESKVWSYVGGVNVFELKRVDDVGKVDYLPFGTMGDHHHWAQSINFMVGVGTAQIR